MPFFRSSIWLTPFAGLIWRNSALHCYHLRSYSDKACGKRFLLRFSEIVERFSNINAPLSGISSLEVGARPRWPHPYDYTNLIKAFGQAGNINKVLRLFHDMKNFSASRPDIICYTAVIDCLVIAYRPAEALAIFEEMIVSGLAPDTTVCTVLVKMYACYLQEFDSAYLVLRWMVKCGCIPDVVTYSTLIAGLCWAGRVEEALGVLDQMLEDECQPNAHTLTPIVHACCSAGKLIVAMKLMSNMEDIGCTPNAVTYNVLIQALCKVGEFHKIDEILDDCNLKGWAPDTITYSVYMDGLCKIGRVEEAFKQLEVMLAKGLYPSDITLNILLDGLCRDSKALQAKYLLDRSAELNWNASVVNYNTVMSRLSDARCCLPVLSLFVDMFKKNISANCWTFSIVVHNLCKAGKLQLAESIFCCKGFVANVMSYTTMIHYLSLAGKMDYAFQLFCQMNEQGVYPNQITYALMINALCRKGRYLVAIGCFYRSLHYEYSSDLVAQLVYELIRGGKDRLVLNILQSIRSQGLVVDVCIFRSLIKAFCDTGSCNPVKMYRVCNILDLIFRIT